MRLNDREFLYTISTANTAGNLDYCNLATAPATCVPDDTAIDYPGLAVIRQFSGTHGKQ